MNSDSFRTKLSINSSGIYVFDVEMFGHVEIDRNSTVIRGSPNGDFTFESVVL
ncbi:hypothetical protein SLEP1_g23498 [Rubroshorea leprosula]|uniref:Uncharacterized protein n=1 Tax=Rubroshorea leprosula TaxID=152421 RepID=A0AAV5JIN6_9ROSI|nr:hypothetical protein SLEP1_g23498 [Rubroshorea leprosula]